MKIDWENTLKRWTELPVWNWIWAFFVILLPVTSMPLIVQLVHSDVVAAPSALLLALLTLAWLIPKVLCGELLPQTIRPLICFVLMAVFCTLLSFFYQIPPYKAVNTISPAISGVLTLLIGFCFFFLTTLWNADEKKRKTTLRLISISGAIVLFWTLLQALCWYKDQRYPEWMRNIQFFMSVGSLYRQRFVGFTLEPSWLAHQLNLLYLPWWFAASVSGYSAFRQRKSFLTAERILFVIGVLVLFLTLSRVGLIAFLLTFGFFAFTWVFKRVMKNVHIQTGSQKSKRLIPIVVFLGMVIVFSLLLLAIAWLLSRLDYRMANLFSLSWQGRSDPIFYIAEKLSLAARFVYWDGGIGIFDRYPIFGVGLGHAGFYLPQTLSDAAWRLTEVRDLVYRSDVLLNIKSLWIRILAETGICGFSLFIVWLISCWLNGRKCLAQSDVLSRTLGWMGCFVLIAFLLEGFSLDTFALPYLWVSLGLCSASADNQMT